MTTPKIEAVAWMVGDEAFPSESLAIEEVRQWGPSGSIAKPVYSQQTVDALLAEVERLRAINSGLCERSNFYLVDSARWQERAERAEAQAEALREAVNKVYAAIPALPIATETMDAATDAFILFCGSFSGVIRDAAIGGRES